MRRAQAGEGGVFMTWAEDDPISIRKTGLLILWVPPYVPKPGSISPRTLSEVKRKRASTRMHIN